MLITGNLYNCTVWYISNIPETHHLHYQSKCPLSSDDIYITWQIHAVCISHIPQHCHLVQNEVLLDLRFVLLTFIVECDVHRLHDKCSTVLALLIRSPKLLEHVVVNFDLLPHARV